MKEIRYLFVIIGIVVLSGCSVFDAATPFSIKASYLRGANSAPKKSIKSSNRHKSGSSSVLYTAQRMISKRVCVRGSCWDYIDAIYKRAGYDRRRRAIIFKSKKRGPYASVDLLRSGDWIYFINRSFHNSEHSSIFVKWINKKRKIARCISYKGQGKRQPARYKNYYLGKVYHIMRPK